ncbi:MAG TPA: transcriptional repressor LexA [Acidobacteriota bacterium]|nr:transcriptional repressor LexA [Acidobacteriota bacterium]
MSLTKRQKSILDFVREFINSNGYSPTLEEIAEKFDLASLNGVYKHLKNLEERGFIRRLPNQSRSIELIDKAIIEETAVPMQGYVAAGQPIEAIPNPETVHVPEHLLTRGRNYVLTVRGDSMIDEHIEEGDMVVVEERSHANNGEMVVALIDGSDATLKKYYREGARIRLQPANEKLQPIYVDEDKIRIQGVVVGLMRRF